MPPKNQPLLVESRNPKVRAKFREARLNKGKTQKDVAIDLKIKESYVRMVENCHVNPSFRRMLMFEGYLGVPSKELFPDIYEESSKFVCNK